MGKKLSKHDRQNRILAKLTNDVTVRISTLAELLDVSTETIRRDIDELTEKGQVNRTYGGAVSIPLTNEPDIIQRRKTNKTEREAIARTAASMINPGDVIMIDSGSTTSYLARSLKKNPVEITVLTNCLAVTQILGTMKEFTVILCPGIYYMAENGVYGHETTEFLIRFQANKAFLSAGGITDYGIKDVDINASWVKRKMMGCCDQIVMLIDHSKINKEFLNTVCRWSAINDLIMDVPPPEDILRSLEKFDVNLHIAE